MTKDDRIPVLLDTDIGDDIDDLFALYLAALHPKLNLIAVTTVVGDVQNKCRLVEKALRQANRINIPIGAGIADPVGCAVSSQIHPSPPYDGHYLSYVEVSDPEYALNYPSAQDVMEHALDTSPQPVAIVGIGAMSNIAQLIKRRKDNVRHIAVMGGETERMLAEWNVLSDPQSADAVFNSGVDVFMGTYQVAQQLFMSLDSVERNYAQSNNPVRQTIAKCTHLWRACKPYPVLFDLAPLFWTADPNTIQCRKSTVRVELTSELTKGFTVRTANDGNVFESVSLNSKVLMDEFERLIPQ